MAKFLPAFRFLLTVSVNDMLFYFAEQPEPARRELSYFGILGDEFIDKYIKYL